MAQSSISQLKKETGISTDEKENLSEVSIRTSIDRYSFDFKSPFIHISPSSRSIPFNDGMASLVRRSISPKLITPQSARGEFSSNVMITRRKSIIPLQSALLFSSSLNSINFSGKKLGIMGEVNPTSISKQEFLPPQNSKVFDKRFEKSYFKTMNLKNCFIDKSQIDICMKPKKNIGTCEIEIPPSKNSNQIPFQNDSMIYGPDQIHKNPPFVKKTTSNSKTKTRPLININCIHELKRRVSIKPFLNQHTFLRITPQLENETHITDHLPGNIHLQKRDPLLIEINNNDLSILDKNNKFFETEHKREQHSDRKKDSTTHSKRAVEDVLSGKKSIILGQKRPLESFQTSTQLFRPIFSKPPIHNNIIGGESKKDTELKKEHSTNIKTPKSILLSSSRNQSREDSYNLIGMKKIAIPRAILEKNLNMNNINTLQINDKLWKKRVTFSRVLDVCHFKAYRASLDSPN